MNDPNGLVFSDGQLHLMYQLNPHEPRWGRMHWGHAVSDDLLTWRHLPVALSPGDDGPDVDGCWSGSIVRDGAETVLFYTGMRLEDGVRRQSICRATCNDPSLVEWVKDVGNPLVPEPPRGIEPELFRDPFVFRDTAGWGMLVGAGTSDGRATVLLYRSPDLRSWSYVGPILSSDDVDRSLGSDGPMWECPQLISGRDADVLIVSVVDRAPGIRPSHVSAFTGWLEHDRFAVARVQQLGMGPDFYAPATTVAPDGRSLLFGWIPEDPPDDGSDRTWAGSLTLPRDVSVTDDGWVSLSLAAEVASLRAPVALVSARDVVVSRRPWRIPLPGDPFEIAISVAPDRTSDLTMDLIDSDPGEPIARISYRDADRLLTVARRGIVSVAGRSAMSAASMPAADGPELHLRVVLDGSVLELEANSHRMATLRLPGHATPPHEVTFSALGGRVRVRSLELWPLVARAG